MVYGSIRGSAGLGKPPSVDRLENVTGTALRSGTYPERKDSRQRERVADLLSVFGLANEACGDASRRCSYKVKQATHAVCSS